MTPSKTPSNTTLHPRLHPRLHPGQHPVQALANVSICIMSVCTAFPYKEALLPNGFCAGILPVTVGQARSIISVGSSDFLVLERATGSILVAEDLDRDGIPESTRTVVAVDGLNHGLAVTSTHLYASTDTEVYRWSYNATTHEIVPDSTEIVVQNMNADGKGGAPFGHTTRTLAIQEATSELYVSVGSGGNIDLDSYRARIRRFKIDNVTIFPFGTIMLEMLLDFGCNSRLQCLMCPHCRLYDGRSVCRWFAQRSSPGFCS
jgi:glucose/arabinose dehydrogenase